MIALGTAGMRQLLLGGLLAGITFGSLLAPLAGPEAEGSGEGQGEGAGAGLETVTSLVDAAPDLAAGLAAFAPTLSLTDFSEVAVVRLGHGMHVEHRPERGEVWIQADEGAPALPDDLASRFAGAEQIAAVEPDGPRRLRVVLRSMRMRGWIAESDLDGAATLVIGVAHGATLSPRRYLYGDRCRSSYPRVRFERAEEVLVEYCSAFLGDSIDLGIDFRDATGFEQELMSLVLVEAAGTLDPYERMAIMEQFEQRTPHRELRMTSMLGRATLLALEDRLPQAIDALVTARDLCPGGAGGCEPGNLPPEGGRIVDEWGGVLTERLLSAALRGLPPERVVAYADRYFDLIEARATTAMRDAIARAYRDGGHPERAARMFARMLSDADPRRERELLPEIASAYVVAEDDYRAQLVAAYAAERYRQAIDVEPPPVAAPAPGSIPLPQSCDDPFDATVCEHVLVALGCAVQRGDEAASAELGRRMSACQDEGETADLSRRIGALWIEALDWTP